MPSSPAGVVTVIGTGGSIVSIPFDRADMLQFETLLVTGPLNAGVTGGSVIPADVTPGGTVPSIAAGQTLEMVAHAGGAYTLPAIPSAFVTDATARVTVTGAPAGATVVAGTGGMTFLGNPLGGTIELAAGGGDNTILVPAGVARTDIYTGNGSDTVVANASANFVNVGSGAKLVGLGAGNATVVSNGDLTLVGGAGNANVTGLGASNMIWFGGGANQFDSRDAIGGSSLIVGSTGADMVFTGTNTAMVYAGTGSMLVSGSGTVVGNSGTLTSLVPAPNVTSAGGGSGALVFAGSGTTLMNVGTGTSTLVGNDAGQASVTLTGGSLLAFTRGQTSIDNFSGGAQTVLGISGSLSVIGATGVYVAAPGGGNTIQAGGDATIYGGGAGDVLSVSQFAGGNVVFVGGTGAETISAAGSPASVAIYAGAGPELIELGGFMTNVQMGTGAATVTGGTGLGLLNFVNGHATTVEVHGFNASLDYFSLAGFGAGEGTTALAGATTSGGNEHLTLSDNTRITLVGFTGLTAANFL